MLGEPFSGQTQVSPPPKSDKKPECQVCGSPSARAAYGAVICIGCKGFFRKSVRFGMSYQLHCLKGEKCIVDFQRGIHCRACRFKKCEAVGLDRHCVKPRPGNKIGSPKKEDQELEMMVMNEDFEDTSLEDFPEVFNPTNISSNDTSKIETPNQKLPDLETPQSIPSYFRTFF